MTPALRLVDYGRPAAEALSEAISTLKAGDPMRAVDVLVPSNHVGVTARRLLGSAELGPVAPRGTGIAAVSFLTVYRMAELVASAELARAGRQPVSTPVLADAYREALATDPGVFAPVADHPATEQALVAAHKELRDCSAASLAALGRTSERAADVVRLHRAAAARLAGAFYDEADLLDTATARLADPDAPGGASPVVCYLPGRLSRRAAGLLHALDRRRGLVVIAGLVGSASGDEETLRSLRRLVPDLDAPRSPARRWQPTRGRIRLVSVSDADEEVRVGVRTVLDAARSGVALERIAVLYPSPEPYARLVHEQFAAAGVPFNGAAAVPAAARLVGRTLLGVLGLARSGFRREDLFTWLSAGRIAHRGAPVPATAWERVSREAGVVAGRDQFDHRLAALADEAEDEADRLDEAPEASPARVSGRRGDAARARQLRAFVLGLADDLARAAGTRPWRVHASWARRLLADLLPEADRAEWPAAEQRAGERVVAAIDRLGRLDGAVDLEVFARTLALELDDDLGRVGRLGEGVLVGPLSFGPGLDLDLVVVLGMAEGSLPAPPRDDALLPDHERAAARGDLALRAHGVGHQEHALFAALASARRQVLLVPRGDLRLSSERVPSRFAVEIVSALAGPAAPDTAAFGPEAGLVEHVASFDAGLRRLAFPATAQEHRLRALLSTGTRPRPADLGDARLSAAAAVLAARRSADFTRFDGNLAGCPVPSPTAAPVAATRLEAFAACPFSYFVGSLLGVEEVENPEDRLTISPLDRGTLVHEVLEAFLREVLARPEADQPAPDEAWSDADHRRLHELAEAACRRYEELGRVGRAIFWRRERRRLHSDLDRFLVEDNAHRAGSSSRPVAAELAFGVPGAPTGPVSLALGETRILRFKGRADRVDETEAGGAEVVDYKTGRSDGFAGLGPEDPDEQGRHLQLAVYALAARARLQTTGPIRATYWFTSSTGGFRRIGYDVTDEVLARVAASLDRVVGAIEAGAFPSGARRDEASGRPGRCPACDPDGLGTAELARHLGAKHADPRVAAALGLERAGGRSAPSPDGPGGNGGR